MIVDVKNCSSCKGNHRVQTVELVDPVSLPGEAKKKEANRFFYCPRTGLQIFVKLEPGQREIDLSKTNVTP